MIKLNTYTNNEKFLSFSFSDCAIDYYAQTKWVNVFSKKQKITIQNSFIAADDQIKQTPITADFLAQNWIQDLYKQNYKILIVSSKRDKPINIYWGKNITLKHVENDFYEFLIDDKPLWTFKMQFLILTKNENPS